MKEKSNVVIHFLLQIIFFLLLFSRRSAQLINPQVWSEDGTVHIPAFIDHGLASIFDPVGGYLIFIVKTISAISLSISVTQYPVISACLTWLFTVFVATCVAKCPTYLKNKFICAVLIFFIPTIPEVFGISIYSFEWASILLFLLVLWKKDSKFYLHRIFLLIIGGLSSPVIYLITPILIFRAIRFKNILVEKILAIIGISLVAVQYLSSPTTPLQTTGFKYIINNMDTTIPVFFGNFFIGNTIGPNFILLWFFSGLIFIVISGYLIKTKFNSLSLTLIYLLFGSIVISTLRTDVLFIRSSLSGPRYFFFTYIFLYWILIQFITTTKSTILKYFLILLIFTGVINAFPVWSENHDDLNWPYQIKRCASTKNFNIPFGNSYSPLKRDAWHVILPQNVCQKLLKEDVFKDINQ